MTSSKQGNETLGPRCGFTWHLSPPHHVYSLVLSSPDTSLNASPSSTPGGICCMSFESQSNSCAACFLNSDIDARHTIDLEIVSEMSSTPVELRFTEFYNKWVSQLEQLHHELLQAATTSSDANQQELLPLISKATAHFKEYYTVKWAAAHEDILAFYAPKWLTPLENARFWFTGFKPTTAFKLVDTLKLTDLTESQMKAIKELKLKVKMEEDKVESDMERQQVGVADWKMVELARMTSRVKPDQSDLGRKVDGMSQVAVSRILGGVEKVMKAGDCVRLKAMKSVLDVLTPRQSVEFLAAIALVHVQLRKEGLKIHDKKFIKH